MLLATNAPSALMQQMKVQVETEGELVCLTIGNATIKMHYEAALQMSQWLRVRAKQCKRTAGDVSRHFSAIGILEDLKT